MAPQAVWNTVWFSSASATIAVVLFLIMMVFITLFIVRMIAQERNR